MANKAGMSKFHFSRTFKSFTGRTFKHYLHEVRVERAKRLLGKDERDVTSVLIEVGFNDQSYFNKVFRRLTGLSPSRYRKRKS